MILAATTAFFIMMLSFAGGLSYWVWSREGAGAGLAEDTPADLPERLRVLYQVGRAVSTEGHDRQLQRNLISAGMRTEGAIYVFYGAKALTFALFPVLTFVLMYSVNPNLFMLLPALVLACMVAFRVPDWYLQRGIAKRRQKINVGLPDFLDLLVISVESGLSLEQGIADTAHDLRRAHPVIHDEISVFQLETQAGTTRSDALRNLSARTREPEMRKLTSLLIQADRFGTSVSKILRTQARYMRTRRRHRAEELAHKVGVKMVFPIFFLIMPSMFLVTAGPALLMVWSGLSGGGLFGK